MGWENARHEAAQRIPVPIELYQLSSGPQPGDPAFGPDPFERRNLYDSTTGTVPSQHQAAFAALTQELASEHPALPTRRTVDALRRSLAGLGSRLRRYIRKDRRRLALQVAATRVA